MKQENIEGIIGATIAICTALGAVIRFFEKKICERNEKKKKFKI